MRDSVQENRARSPGTELARAREQHLPAIEATAAAAVAELDHPPSALSEMYAYHMQTGGKRLRAVLPVMLYRTLGGRAAEIYPFAAAVEVLHNATLVHDDIQDGDRVRRGQPTVWAKFGMPQALNLGSAMYMVALSLARRTGQSHPEAAPALLDLFIRQATEVVRGQTLEFQLQDAPEPTLAAYLDMIAGKTGAMFALALGGAALLANTNAGRGAVNGEREQDFGAESWGVQNTEGRVTEQIGTGSAEAAAHKRPRRFGNRRRFAAAIEKICTRLRRKSAQFSNETVVLPIHHQQETRTSRVRRSIRRLGFGAIIEGIESIAVQLGLIFQVQDDLLDLYGEKGREQRGRDIAEGKISVLAAHVLEVGGPPVRRRLREILELPNVKTTEDDIREAMDIYEQHGARERGLELIETTRAAIERACNHLPPEPGALLIDVAGVFLQPIEHLL